MCLGILFINEVDVVGTNEGDAEPTAVFLQFGVDFLLQAIGLVIGARNGSLMELELQIVVITEGTMIPLDGFLCFVISPC